MFLFTYSFYGSMLLSCAIVSGMHVMELDEENKSEIVPVISIAAQMFSFTGLHSDPIKHLPRHYFTFDSYGKQIMNLALINKNNSILIDNIYDVHKLIGDFSEQFKYSNEKVARGLPFKTARKIVELQTGVFALCKSPSNISWNFFKNYYQVTDKATYHYEKLCYEHLFPVATEERVLQYIKAGNDASENIHVPLLQELCGLGAHLDFTYENAEETPFIALCFTAARTYNDKVLRQLLKFFIAKHKQQRVDMNRVNSGGKNGFMISLARGDSHWVKDYFFRVANQHGMAEEGDINLIKINHQDNEGNTALLIYLDTIKVTNEGIGEFIAAGADPEIGNNMGTTPLTILEKGMQGAWKHAYKDDYDYLVQVIAEKRKS